MTQHYIGTKTVKAVAMSRAAYNEYRGWELPKDENGEDEGYLVEYTDGGQSNHPNHAGYISWSPKAQFEAAYLLLGDLGVMAPHLQRLVGEHRQLKDRFQKLYAFVYDNTLYQSLSTKTQELLNKQLVVMEQYLTILEERLKLELA